MTKDKFNEVIDRSIDLISNYKERGICNTLNNTYIHACFNDLFKPPILCSDFWSTYYLQRRNECGQDKSCINRRLLALEIFRYNCLTYGTYEEF